MVRRRRKLAENPRLLIQLEPRRLELLNDALGELMPGIIRGVFFKEPAEEIPAACQGQADRESKLGAERAMYGP